MSPAMSPTKAEAPPIRNPRDEDLEPPTPQTKRSGLRTTVKKLQSRITSLLRSKRATAAELEHVRALNAELHDITNMQAYRLNAFRSRIQFLQAQLTRLEGECRQLRTDLNVANDWARAGVPGDEGKQES